MSKKKLAILSSHPIQYNAPIFKLLAGRGKIAVKVFYTWGISALENKFDPGFGKTIEWDIPLLEGYDYEFLENTARKKGSHHFRGIINPDIIRQIDVYDPDAILVFGWAFQSHLKVLRHYSKRKNIIFRGDSTLLDKLTFLRRKTRTIFLKWVYSHVNYALYVGSNNYGYFRKMGLKESQLIYAPHAIDNNRFSSMADINERNALDLRSEMGIGSGDIVFLYAGKLEEKKDVRFLLQVFHKAGLNERSQLVIVGNGNLEKELKETYHQVPNIHFMGFQNQTKMPTIYRLADTFILPSKGPGDTWGLGVNEAMACGRSVLVSNKCGCAIDLVEYGRNGYIFEAENRTDLADKLELLVQMGKTGLQEMGQVSATKIKDFSFDKFCEAIEKLLF